VKFTYPDQFGRTPFYGSGGLGNAPGLPFEYLQRLELSNALFGDDVRMEAVLENLQAELIIVTSQSFIEGDHPAPEEIDAYMKAEGFVRTRSEDWYRETDEVAVFDAHPGNYIRTPEGHVIPIDLFPLHHPDAEHLRMMGL
jgi:hypothetical protein